MFLMDGVLIIDKPAGMTSHDVIARVRKLIGERRVGHTGTLDPFATGVLVVMVGRATRLARYLSGAEKEYEAVIRLGYATDTGDVTGARIAKDKSEFHATAQRPQSIGEEDIETALASLRGEIEQTPPMYSAKKIAGRKLYELARRGEEVERKPVRVMISKFEILAHDGTPETHNDDGSRDLKVRVVCSAGTYIRTLAEDFGQRLGLGAHVAALRRTRAGDFAVAQASTLERLSEGRPGAVLISPDAAISHLPAVGLSEDEVRRTLHGIDVRLEQVPADWSEGQPVRLRDLNGELIAVGTYQQGAIHPCVVIAVSD